MNQGETQTHWDTEVLKPHRLLFCSLPAFIGFMLILQFHPFSRLASGIIAAIWVTSVNLGYNHFELKRKKSERSKLKGTA
jgi:hypothetical protein